jgi:malic enzyme
MPENTTADHNNLPDKRALLRKAALEYHEFPKPGKISIAATKQMVNQHDLALAYSPGVAAPCEEIVKDPNAPSNTPAAAIWWRSSPTAPPCWAWATLARWRASR